MSRILMNKASAFAITFEQSTSKSIQVGIRKNPVIHDPDLSHLSEALKELLLKGLIFCCQ